MTGDRKDVRASLSGRRVPARTSVSGRRHAPAPGEVDPDLPKRNSPAALVAIGAIGLALALLAWLLFRPAPMIAQPPPVGQTGTPASGARSTARPMAGASGNHPPKAVLRMRQDPGNPSIVEFSALFSEDTDPGDEDRLTFLWDFGDGTTGTASEGRHQFVKSGALTMVLTVTDPKGGMATDKARIVVPAPAAAVAVAPTGTQVAGLRCQRIRVRVDDFAAFDRLLPGADAMVALDIGLDLRPRDHHYGLRFTGFIAIPTAGDWTFTLTSDDGSRLTLGDTRVVVMDAMQGATKRSARVRCEAGLIPLQVDYYQGGGDAELRLEWAGPGEAFRRVPVSTYFHTP